MIVEKLVDEINKAGWLITYDQQRRNAKRRGIPFLLTYKQWLRIWQDSGHLHERGPKSHQYVMARLGDVGPYAVGNVKIVTAAENHKSKRLSAEARAKIGAASRGNQYRVGKRLTEEHKQAIRQYGRTRELSEESKRKISVSVKRSWEARR